MNNSTTTYFIGDLPQSDIHTVDSEVAQLSNDAPIITVDDKGELYTNMPRFLLYRVLKQHKWDIGEYLSKSHWVTK